MVWWGKGKPSQRSERLDLDFSHPSFWNASPAGRQICGDICAQTLPASAPNGGVNNILSSVSLGEVFPDEGNLRHATDQGLWI